MNYYKIMNNNMVIDILKEEPCYVRYLTGAKRIIAVQKDAANGVMGSDKNTVYHLEGTINNFPNILTTVTILKIELEEYKALETQFSIYARENANLRNEINEVKKQLDRQNDILQQILFKL